MKWSTRSIWMVCLASALYLGCDGELGGGDDGVGDEDAISLDDVAAAVDLPARIQAENYNPGGEGVGYHDLSAGNIGGEFRAEDVDIQVTTDAGGGYNVAWTEAGEWLAYSVNVATRAEITFVARVASGLAGTKTLHLVIDGAALPAVSFTDSSGFQAWRNLSLGSKTLAAGPHKVKIFFDTRGSNLNFIDATAAATASPLVVVCDHNVHGIRVLDPNGTWSLSAALWSWKASDSPQIRLEHRDWFARPNEAKLRDNGQTLLVAGGATPSTGGVGGVAIVRVSDKRVMFYYNGGNRTHSLERLPDGNLVSVSTTDNKIRVMSTDPTVSNWPDQVVHTDYVGDLPHGAVWDPVGQRLWISGNIGLAAYTYNFNRQNPKLTRDTAIPLQRFPEAFGGHDLYPVLGQRKLFATNNGHVWVFDLATRTFAVNVPDHPILKGFGLNPAGHVVGNSYGGPILFGTQGSAAWTSRPLEGSNVYKSRWWMVTELAP